jgi:hypothetical protein
MHAVQVQVIGVEPRHLLQPLGIQHREDLGFELNQPLLTKALQHAVGVHGRDAGRIRQLLLSNRELERLVRRQAHHPKELLDGITDAVEAFDLAGSWRVH